MCITTHWALLGGAFLQKAREAGLLPFSLESIRLRGPRRDALSFF